MFVNRVILGDFDKKLEGGPNIEDIVEEINDQYNKWCFFD